MEDLQFSRFRNRALGFEIDRLWFGDEPTTLDRYPFRIPAIDLTLGNPLPAPLRRGFSLPFINHISAESAAPRSPQI